MMPTGTVKWFDADKGYGFIEDDEGKGDYFVHFTSIAATGGFRTLEDGQRVRFEVTTGDRGKPAATQVEPV
jgi:CspA family cold shock protein